MAVEARKSLGERGRKQLRGGYPLENSSVLAYLFTVYGEFGYFSLFFFPLLYFSIQFFLPLLGIFWGRPPLKILEGDTSPRPPRPPPMLIAMQIHSCM